MKANVTKQKQITVDRKTVAAIGLAVVVLGGVVYWLFFAEPAPAWRVRWQIQRYLKKQSGKHDFRVDFKFPSKAAMAKAPAESAVDSDAGILKGKLTKKDFDTLREEYMDAKTQALRLEGELDGRRKELDQQRARLAEQEKALAAAPTNVAPNRLSLLQSNTVALRARVAGIAKEVAEKQQAVATREKALAPMVSDLWGFQREWTAQLRAGEATGTNELAVAVAGLSRDARRQLAEAQTYEAMYRILGQELWVAGRLFKSANPQHRLVALAVARQVGSDAMREAEDSWLAARICEGYIWPHLDVLPDASRRVPMSLESVVNDCSDVFRRADEPLNVIRNYELLLATTKNTQRADWARVRIAQAYEREGEFDSAVRYLKQVKGTNDFGWALRRLPWLEQQAKLQ